MGQNTYFLSRQKEIKEAFARAGIEVFFISAATGQGVSELMSAVAAKLKQIELCQVAGDEVPRKVFRPQPKELEAKVKKEGDTFVVSVPDIMHMVALKGVSDQELRQQLKRRLARYGVIKELEKAGIKPGDKVRCGTLEWEW